MQLRSSNPLEELKVPQVAGSSVVQLESAKELKSYADKEPAKVSQVQLESAKELKSNADNEEPYGIVSVDGVAGGVGGIDIPREKRQLLGALLHGILHGGDHYDDHHHHHGGYGKIFFKNLADFNSTPNI